MSKWISNRELLESLGRTLPGFEKKFLNEWAESEPQPIYILASSYQIAKSIFDHYFRYTGLSRIVDLRYIDRVERLYGLRNWYIVVSNERYPNDSFYDRIGWIRDNAQYRSFELIYEQDLENEQVREKVSRQRPKAPKGE